MYYDEFKTYFSSIYYNNIAFTDEKSFILNNLFKLRVRKNPVTGTVPECVKLFGANTRKRYNIMDIIRLYPT